MQTQFLQNKKEKTVIKDVQLSVQMTPNPNTIKFMVNLDLVEKGPYDFPTPQTAKHSPLANLIFEIPGISGVMIGNHFVSVSKISAVEWSEIAEPITETIKSHLGEEKTVIDPDYILQAPSHGERSFSEIEQKIIDILDHEIRPAIAMDGGDVSFHSFQDGVVTLRLQGACSSCPSSVLTLKMGIENRLREEIPEVLDVVQI